MQVVRSVLFVDFDNIFGGLLELDREAGLAFAQQPSRWLSRLCQKDAEGRPRRRFLQSRAYLNPNGVLKDDELGNDNGNLFLQKFRPNLTRAGFEVVDCPTLTSRQKNAADIRIVIDILTSLEANGLIQEVIIASSDADFTPLLHVLRSRDLRTVVMSANDVSSAYEAVASDFLGPEAMISLVTSPTAATSAHTVELSGDARADAERIVLELLVSSDEPVLLAQVGKSVRAALNAEVEDSSWFGHRSLSGFALSLTTSSGRALAADQNHLWDPDSHDPPTGELLNDSHTVLPPTIRDLRSSVDFPVIPSESWPILFNALADYALTEVFSLIACTMAVRDRLRESATGVSRPVVSYVVKGAKLGGVRLDAHPPPTADEIRSAFKASVVDRYESAGLQLLPDEDAMLDDWLLGTGAHRDDSPAGHLPSQ